jgi:hypothetical protein
MKSVAKKLAEHVARVQVTVNCLQILRWENWTMESNWKQYREVISSIILKQCIYFLNNIVTMQVAVQSGYSFRLLVFKLLSGPSLFKNAG